MKKTVGIILLCMIATMQLFAINTATSDIGDGNSNPPCHTVQITGTNVDCFGNSNGSAIRVISGGIGPFVTSWSTGASGNSISGLTAGFYNVQVIDQSTGCSAFDIVEITQPDLLTTSISSVNVNCFGQNTGSIDLSVSGGTPGYSYSWSNSSSAQDINSLVAGYYYVTLTDNNGCIANDSVEITQPNTALNSSYQSYDISCNGLTDGEIDITAWGGSPPYNYTWSNGAFTEDVNGLSFGSYSVTITDDKSCTSVQSAIIQEPTLLFNTSAVVDANCFGSTDGSVDVSVFGGVPPYTFQWENSSYQLSYNSEDLINFGADQYVITIRDSNLCLITDTFVIGSPTEIILSFQTIDVSSNGGVDGAINLTVTGGVPLYSYLWSNGATTQDLTGIPSGIYTVTVTDNQSCYKIDSVEIYEPLLALGYQVVTKDVTCHGGGDGEIYLFAQGGVSPYEYDWSSIDTVSIITNLVAGNYIFTITDANNIELIDTIEITQPDQIAFSYTYDDVSCYGFADGQVDLTVTGGTSPYSFEWFNSDYVLAALTEDVLYMKADTYMVVVTDTFGCSSSCMVIISQPEEMQANISSDDVECFGGNTGNIDLEVIGGTLPYLYLWSNGATTQDLSNVPAGTYTVTVTDAEGCFIIESVSIQESIPIEVVYDVQDVSCIDNHDGRILAYPSGGTGTFDYLWSTGEITDQIVDLDQGTYFITITDIYGCTYSDSVYVDKDMQECINIPSAFTPNGDAYNDKWIINNIGLYPNCSVKV
ncbi:MAG: hypothetical protein DRN30_03380, partial [Thermoplasmata archaeon]